MRTFISVLSTILFLCILFPANIKAEVTVSAEHAVLMDQSSGRILYEKQADESTLIASITKIMTAIIAIESGDLNDKVTISENAALTEGSSIYLKKGEKVLLKDLLYGLMLRSGNDAAVAISEYIGGSEQSFVLLMNEKAKWLGMTHTHFDNPHGLDSDTHYSSARDMAILMKYASENETFNEISSTKSYKGSVNDYSWVNKNKLLTHLYDHSTGGKTGFTKAAGRTLVSTAEQNGQALIAVTINAPDDWRDHMHLFEWGFETFPLRLIQEKSSFEIELKDSKNPSVTAKITEDIKYPLKNEEENDITYKDYIAKDALSSTIIGKRIFYLNGASIMETLLYGTAKEKQEENKFWKRFKEIWHMFLGDNHD